MSSSIADAISVGDVTLTPLLTSKLLARRYNALLLSLDFWRALHTRSKVLVFQTDSFCCAGSDYQIGDFLNYDYIGACWRRRRPVGLQIDGGCGGFSLRDWARSVECIERFPPMSWRGGEDGYFAFHLDLIGANVASLEQASQFCTQYEFKHKSFAAHSLRSLKEVDRSRFLEYAPESRFIFPKLF